MSKLISFFATRDDLLCLLGEVELKWRIHYTEAGMFETPEIIVYCSSPHIPQLGITHWGTTITGLFYLIADAATSFKVRPVPQRRGGIRYAMDQKENPDTVTFFPGGRYDNETVIAGNFSTCTNSQVSADLMQAIARLVRKKWTKIKSYSVGPEAMAILESGGRLTADIRSPREYDLKK